MGKPTKSTKNGRLWVEISSFVRFEFGSVHNYEGLNGVVAFTVIG